MMMPSYSELIEGSLSGRGITAFEHEDKWIACCDDLVLSVCGRTKREALDKLKERIILFKEAVEESGLSDEEGLPKEREKAEDKEGAITPLVKRLREISSPSSHNWIRITDIMEKNAPIMEAYNKKLLKELEKNNGEQ